MKIQKFSSYKIIKIPSIHWTMQIFFYNMIQVPTMSVVNKTNIQIKIDR